MKKVIFFHLFFLGTVAALFILRAQGKLPVWVKESDLWFVCTLMGGSGGAVYCLRGVYLTACVKNQWNDSWLPWYFIRPFVSLVCGAVSCLFLKAGLLVLGAGKQGDASDLGFFALAFIAGLNVDKFMNKLEDIAHSTWGIEKSRALQPSQNPKDNDQRTP